MLSRLQRRLFDQIGASRSEGGRAGGALVDGFLRHFSVDARPPAADWLGE